MGRPKPREGRKLPQTTQQGDSRAIPRTPVPIRRLVGGLSTTVPAPAPPPAHLVPREEGGEGLGKGLLQASGQGCPPSPRLWLSLTYLLLSPLHRTQVSGVPWLPSELVSRQGSERLSWPCRDLGHLQPFPPSTRPGICLQSAFRVSSSRGRSREKAGREEEPQSSCLTWPQATLNRGH